MEEKVEEIETLNPLEEKGTFKLLIKTFLSPVKNFGLFLKRYFYTFFSVYSFPNLENKSDSFLPDVKFAFFTFEIVLIILFGSKLFESEEEINEFRELLRDVFELILFFVFILLNIGIGRLWRWVFKVQSSRREVDSYFIYEFNMLFLPAYIFLLPVYQMYPDNGDMFDGLSLLFLVFWVLHLCYFFIRLSKRLGVRKLKGFMSLLIFPGLVATLLLVASAILVGISAPN